MLATATLSSYRQSPRKVRLVARLVKGKSVAIALSELHHRSKRAAPVFEKLIRSAVANAKVLGMNERVLLVENIRVDKGPVLKRSMPRAHGRAFPIHKHTSHISVTLSEVSDKPLTTKEKRKT
ncbi:MAG: 50S ribosomal protein L22 [Patescibacteria group bacterium]